MKVVISCCNGKNGELFQYDGENIHFVARPDIAPNNGDRYVHPDDIIPNQAITWRQLIKGNQNRPDLIAAYELYKPIPPDQDLYNNLYQRFGQKFYIFSAGWGIVRADYKLPNYDITFSTDGNNQDCVRRNNNQLFDDFNDLRDVNNDEEIGLIAPKDYVSPFCRLTGDLHNSKIIIIKNLAVIPNEYNDNNSFQFRIYETQRRTNWHYEYARRLINGEIHF